MSAANYDINNIEQGSTYRKKFIIKTKESSRSKSIEADLTGFRARMRVRVAKASRKPTLELTTENGGLTIDVQDSSINLYIPESQTKKLSGKKVYFYDIELVKDYPNLPEPEVTKILYGTLQIWLEETTW